jgi:thiol-disulfide isomerase/thioredoxin
MKRRDFMLAFGAASLVPLTAQAAGMAYQTGLVQERLAAGETVFLDFKAEWCTTCRAQERVINALKDENPAYAENITFIDVDWDEFGRSDIVDRYNVPRRSTLIALKGDREIGRIVAGTSRQDIQTLMDGALNAAVS